MTTQKHTIDDFAMMEAMRYYNSEEESAKRTDILNNKNNEYIASVKNDGCWSLCIHYSKGNNLIRSRSISKVTGVYGDYTEKVPHLVAEMDNWPDNTAVLAELCWDKPGTNANTVGTILRCLPAKAVERQKDEKLVGKIFDILMYDGVDLTSTPYEERIIIWAARVSCMDYSHYFKRTPIIKDGVDFREAADEVIAAGGEGIVIQRKDNPYMPGTRTAWKTLKLKQSLPEMELKVIATIEPKKDYEGEDPEHWQFRDENGNPVTKPYFYGWMNGIRVEHGDFTTDVTSGLTDMDREWLATMDAQEMIRNGELYAVVKAMSFNDKGALRHPYVVRLRNDL